MQLREAVVVVTGGAGGLGTRVCRRFAREGARLAIADLQGAEWSEALAAELRAAGAADSLFAEADLTRSDGIAAMVEQVLVTYGRIDVLVNAAAINQWVPFTDLEALDEALWEQLLRIDLMGPYLCSRAIGPIMKRQGNGRIVNVTSVAGFLPTGSSIAYAVAKAGLAHLTRCLAVALAPEVLVNSVAPGLMEETAMGQKVPPDGVEGFRQRAALNRTTKIDDVAEQIVAFARTDSITGQNLLIDCGIGFR